MQSRKLYKPINERYGKLQVVDISPNYLHGKRAVLVQCDCGTEKLVNVDSLRKGISNSCGCAAKTIRHPSEIVCLQCGKKVLILHKGQPRKYCSDSCRQKFLYHSSEKGLKYALAARLKKVGLTVEQYQVVLTQQDNKCAICLQPKELVVDHDHVTGAFRGLLCSSCNTGLGLLGDTYTTLARAAGYLNSDKTVSVSS